jgi:hypothetical protein
MRFGQILSQNVTKIRKCSSLDYYMLLTVWSRLSFAHRLQKVGGFVVGKAPPTGYPR